MRSCAVCILLLGLLAAPHEGFSEVVHERIYYITDDGENAFLYSTTRTDRENYSLYAEKGKSLDEVMGKFLYVYPPQYRLLEPPEQDYNAVQFQGGSYGSMLATSLDVEVSNDGVYHWSNRSSMKSGRHKGYWSRPRFDQLSVVWVFPGDFVIKEYSANRQGEWRKSENVLSFFAEETNDVVIDVAYKPRQQELYEALQGQVGRREGIGVEQSSEAATVVFLDDVLFASGSAKLSEPGRQVLRKVTDTLKRWDDITLKIEGHTDNQPIRGELAETYPTNWELSAARSLAVLRQLVDLGVPPDILKAVAHGAQRPRATNRTPQGRAQNRRIELRVVPRSRS